MRSGACWYGVAVCEVRVPVAAAYFNRVSIQGSDDLRRAVMLGIVRATVQMGVKQRPGAAPNRQQCRQGEKQHSVVHDDGIMAGPGFHLRVGQ
jgi:hypothetical protein